MSVKDTAEVFVPGSFVREEIEAREWTQIDLAEITGKSPRLINEVIAGKRAITAETAKALGEAFGTSADLWMNLEGTYQLSKVKADSDVSRRARLYGKYPVKAMVNRHWIEPSENIDVLESRFCEYFNIKSLDEQPTLPHAAKQGVAYSDELQPQKVAWLFRAKELAERLSVEKFIPNKLPTLFENLRLLLPEAEEIRKIPGLLARAGIRFVIVEAFPGMRLDGVCFWLDGSSPVIALTTLHDRIDNFWFVLLHELRHIVNGDGKKTPIFDVEIAAVDSSDNELEDMESQANDGARSFLVSDVELQKFVLRVKPLYGRVKIVEFAASVGVHPGIVVGQLQFRKEIPFSHHRRFLVSVRKHITATALTDGWGSVIS